MLQKLNLALSIVLILLVAALALIFWNWHRDSQTALEMLSTQVRDLRSATRGGDGEEANGRNVAPSSPGTIAISGSIARPGIYSLPGAGGLTVTRAITAAGGSTLASDANVLLIRADGERSERPLSKYLADKQPTFLESGDHLHIEAGAAE
jgi:hypothetical protein